MRTIFLLGLNLLFSALHSQELVINPPAGSGNFSLEEFGGTAPNDHIASGIITGLGAPIMRLSNTNIVWAKYIGPAGSRSRRTIKLASGNYLMVGSLKVGALTDGLAVCIDPAGILVWSRTYDSLGKSEIFYDVVESPDGNIYLSGQVNYTVGGWRSILLKIDQGGNLLWSKMVPVNAQYTACGRLAMIGPNVLIAGTEGIFSNTDPAVWVMDQNGIELLHRSFGDSTITSLDASFDLESLPGGEFLVSTSLNELGVNRIGLVQLSSALMPIPGAIWKYETPGATLQSGKIIVSGSTIYVAGGYHPPGVINTSFAMKLDTAFMPAWITTLADHVNVSAKPILDGNLHVVSTDDGWITTMPDIRIGSLSPTTGQANTGFCQVTGTIPITRAPYTNFRVRTFAPTSWGNLFYSVNLGPSLNTWSPILDSCAQIVMPVELLSFTGEEINGRVRLRWQTATEIDNDYFEMMRSRDLQNFEVVDVVAGAGTSTEAHEYESWDEYPYNGTSYYRLRQVDLDGNSSFSEVIPITVGTPQGNYELANFAGQVVFVSSTPDEVPDVAAGIYLKRVLGTEVRWKVLVTR